MISVFLDESGNFEDINYKLKFIGGLIYTGDDLKEEECRIEQCLKDVCQSLKIVYPNDIHTTKMNCKSKKIKEALSESLINHFHANGKYHFTYMVCGSNKKNYIKNNSNIIEEEFASNLYDNMIANLIQNILFYNPYLTDRNYYLNIASRIAQINVDDSQKMEEYKKLGYEGNIIDNKKKYIFYLNNNTAIKAAISSKMVENRINKDIGIDLNVQKINYKNTKKDQSLSTTPFLYAADISCNLIKNVIADVSNFQNKYNSLKGKLTNIKKKDFYISETVKKLEEISGTKVFAWAYDDIEKLWGDLNLAVYRKDFLSALDYLYEIKKNSSPFAKFYYNFWCKRIEKELEPIFNKDEVELYIAKIENYSLNKNKSEYEKGLFLAKKIKKYFNNLKGDNKKEYLFKLNDVLLTGYNHRGDIVNGHKCIDECEENKNFVDTQTYVHFLIRELQTFANEFNYDKCIKISKDIKDYLEILKENEKEIAACLNKKITGNTQRGKIYSSLGQFYGFEGEKDEALKYFSKALDEFKYSRIDKNRETTLSYLLHLAVEQRDFELFEKYMKELWNSSDLEEIFKKITDNKSNKRRYQLYLYLKALDTFYIESVSEKLLNNIVDFDYKGSDFEQVHPWELIYKYLAIICLKKQSRNKAQNMINKIDEIDKIKGIGGTIKLININSKIEYLQLDSKLNKSQNQGEIDKLLSKMERVLTKYTNINKVFGSVRSENGKLQLDKLNTVFTYMYR
jgi:hypothetical protein